PLLDDTDGDSIKDGLEYWEYGTDPLLEDTDGDQLSDSQEIGIFHTNATNADSDGDGINDFIEAVILESNPWYIDSDYDRLSDTEEYFTYGTSLTDQDSDNDEISDYDEVKVLGSNPLSIDTDNDLLNDTMEYFVYDTNLTLWDSDFDGWSDFEEVVFGTNPNNQDTDGDWIPDPQDAFATTHWGFQLGGILALAFVAAVLVKRVRDRRKAREYVTRAEPASEGLEPGMDIAVEYKIREGKVVFGVVIRNGSRFTMSNVMVILGIPDLTDAIKSKTIGTVDPDAVSIVQIEFELQPGAQGELVGMLEYDTEDGEHRVVNLRPVKIVA
ncbi:MAG: hypothetical protein ACFFED_10030, partial [Candidatus Thorarchaeota archaeon]